MTSNYSSRSHHFDSDGFRDFVFLLAEKGLSANKKYFPEDYYKKQREPCFMTHYNTNYERAWASPLIYKPYALSVMPAKLMFASMKKVQVLFENPHLVETRTVANRELGIFGGGARFDASIFGLSGFEPRIDEACDIVGCLWDNRIRDPKDIILETWKDPEISNIAEEIFYQMFGEIGW